MRRKRDRDHASTDAAPRRPFFPERTVTIRCDQGVRCLRLTPLSQAVALGLGALAGVWLTAATGMLALQGLGDATGAEGATGVAEVYEARVGALEAALAEADAKRTEAERVASAAAAELAARHDALAQATASREALPVFAQGRQVGRVTSSTWSPTLKQMIALATVDTAVAGLGATVEVEHTVDAVRHRVRARVTETPFFNPPRKTATPPA